MIRTAEIRRYARTLARQAQEEGVLDPLRRGLQSWTEAMGADKLQVALSNPGIPLPSRHELLRQVAARLGSAEAAQRVVTYLMEQNLLATLPELYRLFAQEADRLTGRARVKLRSARALSPEQQRQVAEALGRRLQQEVVLETEVDPALIGGVVASAGDLSFDGSLRSRLQRLGEYLRQQAAGAGAETGQA